MKPQNILLKKLIDFRTELEILLGIEDLCYARESLE
jgi:hypothetical protein